jgi:hypothetical protein
MPCLLEQVAGPQSAFESSRSRRFSAGTGFGVVVTDHQPQVAIGGRLINMASTLPPVRSPKAVPRS